MPCVRPSSGSHGSNGYLADGQAANCHPRLQDHFQALVYILAGGRPIPEWLRPVHSHSLRARKSSEADYQQTQGSDAVWPARDAAFRARIAAANEWTDLELLFRTLAELKAEPLILSMPIDAYAARGVSHSTRELYYDRMRELSARYHFPVIEFEQHDADPRFLIAHREHPTPRGWMVYDRALDDFFRKSK
jgi:D-alanine transfer protein